MASTTVIPTYLLPRGISGSAFSFFTTNNAKLRIRSSVCPTFFLARGQPRFTSSQSTTPSKKPHVLEKPDKFRPPSHPARRVVQVKGGSVEAPRNYPGPQLSAEELAEKKKRKYPHMFPPEGTVMHKFLTSRGIHVWISMVCHSPPNASKPNPCGTFKVLSKMKNENENSTSQSSQSVLVALATFTFSTNFKRTSPFAHLLPPWSQILTHPFDTIYQVFWVFKMHSDHVSLQTAEKRKRNIDDVDKRREYRRAQNTNGLLRQYF